jgi:hypothetical protein
MKKKSNYSKTDYRSIKAIMTLLFILYCTAISATDNFVEKRQQQANVTGQVKSVEGITLPGVNVLVKGTSIGVITDNDGI